MPSYSKNKLIKRYDFIQSSHIENTFEKISNNFSGKEFNEAEISMYEDAGTMIQSEIKVLLEADNTRRKDPFTTEQLEDLQAYLMEDKEYVYQNMEEWIEDLKISTQTVV